jgi:hypothetical protein
MMLHCTLLWSLEIPLILKLTVTLGCHLRNDSTLYRFGHAIGTNLSDGYVFFSSGVPFIWTPNLSVSAPRPTRDVLCLPFQAHRPLFYLLNPSWQS